MCGDSKDCAIKSGSPGKTLEFGRLIGQNAAAGDLICLSGDLGAGKTTFVQGIAEGLGVDSNAVSSPTYALIAEHLDGRIPLLHMDIYRLSRPEQLYDTGFDDFLRRADSLIVIEWGERAESYLPADRLEVRIGFGGDDDARTIEIGARGPASRRLMDAIC